ncbi:serine hydrolase domain-containing protein [Streptomyces virginiae]|uniref:serine hydrolase domain-containing protein n=1 Tax=Streptomyces virginiae TaxID=1961 RepID=UPI00381F06AA
MHRRSSYTAGAAMILVALTGVVTPRAYAADDDRAQRSAAVLRDLVPSPDGPGCAAAVGERGEVVWEAGRGRADLATGRAITSKTVFDMASNSKQFTADAVLLLAGRHQLSLDDPLSGFLDDPPAWTRQVTLGDLMRHTSGIPDYQDLLEAQGVEVTDPAGQQEAIAAEAKSYAEKDGSFTPDSSPWKQYGDGSVQTTPGEMVRWADNYRIGRVGGPALLAAVTRGAVGVGDVLRGRGIEAGRYGAGVLLLPDDSLVHRGDWEQFHSTFKVSPDRNTAVTVVCNADAPDHFRAANRLMAIWTT